MRLDCNAYIKHIGEYFTSIDSEVKEYRTYFLMRKNVSDYKKNIKGTPIVIDKLLNSLDRKIKGKSIFTNEVKQEYFKGLQLVFNLHYDETFLPKISKKKLYSRYCADMYCWHGKSYNSGSYKDFINSGMIYQYRK